MHEVQGIGIRLANEVSENSKEIIWDTTCEARGIMDSVQIRLTERQVHALDALIKRGIYPSRSEAVRDAVRKLVEK